MVFENMFSRGLIIEAKVSANNGLFRASQQFTSGCKIKNQVVGVPCFQPGGIRIAGNTWNCTPNGASTSAVLTPLEVICFVPEQHFYFLISFKTPVEPNLGCPRWEIKTKAVMFVTCDNHISLY